METKHTSGEWNMVKYPHCIAIETKLKNGGEHTIVTNQFCYAGTFDGSAEANAKLIAAAPDLLEVLMEIKLSIDGGGDVVTFMPHNIEKINNVIKKATE